MQATRNGRARRTEGIGALPFVARERALQMLMTLSSASIPAIFNERLRRRECLGSWCPGVFRDHIGFISHCAPELILSPSCRTTAR
jgi:hypothetical protein